jgi:hypothetical protein
MVGREKAERGRVGWSAWKGVEEGEGRGGKAPVTNPRIQEGACVFQRERRKHD